MSDQDVSVPTLEPERPPREPDPYEFDESYRRRSPGPRQRRAQHVRKAGRKKTARSFLIAVGASVLLVAMLFAIDAATKLRRKQPVAEETAAAASQETWLLLGTVAGDPTGQADWMIVASWDKTKETGLFLYLPRTTYSEIPGHGLDTIEKSLALGGEDLARSTVANLLGITFDHHLRISDGALRQLFDKLGPVTVTVGQRLTRTEADGKVRTAFLEGEQQLPTERVVEYLTFITENGDEISRGARHSEIWQAVFDKHRGQTAEFGKIFSEAGDSLVTDASPQQLQVFMSRFVNPKTDLLFEILPVKATGVETGLQQYAPEREAVEQLVANSLSGSRPPGSSQGRRVEILNGNGAPGIGQEVSTQLIQNGFRVVLDQNANSFDYEITQIVLYSDSKEALALGDEVKRLLGVGDIVVSKHKQTIVDVTVVVGKDYLRVKGQPG